MTKNATLWTTVKDELRERREARAEIRRLRTELAAYTTPQEITDLLEIVDAHDALGAGVPEAPVIRDILTSNLRRYYASQQPQARTVAL